MGKEYYYDMKINPHVLGRMISHPVVSTRRSLPLDINPESCGDLSAETQANVPPLGTAEVCCVQHTVAHCGLPALGRQTVIGPLRCTPFSFAVLYATLRVLVYVLVPHFLYLMDMNGIQMDINRWHLTLSKNRYNGAPTIV
eukprot:COSAG02_NODE_5440_length_4328_cov_4.242374_2_plen_141_part_00